MRLGRTFEAEFAEMWKSRTVSTPVMDVIDEKGTCETRRVGCYEFVQFTRYCSATGQLWAGGMAMAHLPLRRRSISALLTIALEDHVACPIPAKRGALAGE